MANVEALRNPDCSWNRSSKRGDRLDVLAPEERAVIAAVRETRFGAVEVVVHQSRVVQLVRSEKLRLETTPSP